MSEATDATRSSDGGHEKDKYPYVHPENLGKAEHLAVDADDVEDFIEHFSHHEEHEKAHAEKRQSEAREH